MVAVALQAHGKEIIMINFEKYISKDDISKVEATISKAESKTSCEIVPVIIDYADNYPHASILCGFMFSLVSVILLWFIAPPKNLMQYYWSTDLELEYLGILILVMVVSFLNPNIF